MASFLRRLPLLTQRWKPLEFANPNFGRIPADQKTDEERLPGYVASRYYPVRIGDILNANYQIVGKLGYGISSTVWLARDLSRRRHVALKLFVHSASLDGHLDNESNMYKRMKNGPKDHPGRMAVRELLDSFEVDGPCGRHRCLVHQPLFESLLDLLHRNDERKFPPAIVAFTLQRLFYALDFLHKECQIIHTDIKADNIMLEINDDSVFRDFEHEEQHNPSPRKKYDDGRIIYACRQLPRPKKWGAPVLCDFGSAVLGTKDHLEDVQPDVYRSPEVILEVPWGHKIDIWNAGSNQNRNPGQIWDIFEGRHLFFGHDPEHQVYRGRAHLLEMIAVLGPPPKDLLDRANLRRKFFSDQGEFSAGISVPYPLPLRDLETRLDGQSKEQFLRLMSKMLQWEPGKRCCAADLLEDEWIQENT